MDKRRDLEHAADEIEQLFADLWQVFPFSRGLRRGFRPQVDCYRTDREVVVVFELPGVDPDAIHLVAGPQALVLAGERVRPKDCGHFRQMEIDYGPFQRQVTWDDEIDPEAATASYERGMLRITLPIAPRRAPQERVPIAVRTSR
jgi:HSP20 family molecular chaperone IbpA